MVNLLLFLILLTPNSYNVYSPFMLKQNGNLYMYFGGWNSPSDIPNDSIYRANCNNYPCSNIVKVLTPAPLTQINDPTIVNMGNYYIMYYTGSPDGGLTGQGIYYSTSWVTDGVNWSPPTLLMNDYWLPSVTMYNGRVLLYTNSRINGLMNVFDLGANGISVGSPSLVNSPQNYDNVDVIYRPSINLFQIMAQSMDGSRIDYLTSLDGINWQFIQTIKMATNGTVITPAQHPDTSCYIYFGQGDMNFMNNQIYFESWC